MCEIPNFRKICDLLVFDAGVFFWQLSPAIIVFVFFLMFFLVFDAE